jgi:hypothetical protein
LEDAVRESIAGTSIIQNTFQNDAPEKTGENALTGGAEAIEGPGKIEEVASIAGVTRRDESGRSVAERRESAAVARTAATSLFAKIILSQSPRSYSPQIYPVK